MEYGTFCAICGKRKKIKLNSFLLLSAMNKFLFTVISFACTMSVRAQQGSALTAKDYERAESMMGYNTEQLVDGQFSGHPNWLPDDRFWYRILTAHGSE